ncbi:MAG: ion transporter [Arenicella sp.]
MHQRIQRFAKSRFFQNSIIAVILFTALLIGIESFPQLMSNDLLQTFEQLHDIILWIFILEAAIKLIAAWPKPQEYFQDSWNVFDFTLIVLSLLPFSGQFAMIGRLLRLFRVLRLVAALPELRLIVETLLRSIPSMLNVIILMSIIFFIYGVAGYHLFHEHDPTHWRDLSYAILTLFRIVTLEDWTDVMYKAMELSPYYGFYFVSFVVFGTFIVINLFMAVVINNLDEAKMSQLSKLENPDLHQELMQTLQGTREKLEHLEAQLNALKNQK